MERKFKKMILVLFICMIAVAFLQGGVFAEDAEGFDSTEIIAYVGNSVIAGSELISEESNGIVSTETAVPKAIGFIGAINEWQVLYHEGVGLCKTLIYPDGTVITGDTILSHLCVVGEDGRNLNIKEQLIFEDDQGRDCTADEIAKVINEYLAQGNAMKVKCYLSGYENITEDFFIEWKTNAEEDSSEVGIPVDLLADADKFCFSPGTTITGDMMLHGLVIIDAHKNNLNMKDSIVFINAKGDEFTAAEMAEQVTSSLKGGAKEVPVSCYISYNGEYVDGVDFYVRWGKYGDNTSDNTYDEGIIDISGDANYTTHVENVGWQKSVDDGDMSGTQGKGLRLEGIKIKSGLEGVGVSYATHVQNIGWQDFVNDGSMSGTSGKSLRLEAIKIELTGTNAEKFDIYYQVHAQNMGWLGIAKNGESAGTAGFGYRLEGIRIQIVAAGSAAPSWSTTRQEPFYENNEQLYQEIINEYRIAENDVGDYETITRLPHVNPNMILQKCLLYYTLKDISGDGNDELIIAADPEVDYNGLYTGYIYDIYTIRDGVAKRIIDVSDVGNGKAYSVTVLDGNRLCKRTQVNPNKAKFIFQILPDGHLNTIYSAYSKDGLFCTYYFENGEQKWKTISDEEYRNLDKNKMNFKWWEPLWK